MPGEACRLNCQALDVPEAVPRQVVESFEAAPCYDVVTPLDLRHKRAQR